MLQLGLIQVEQALRMGQFKLALQIPPRPFGVQIRLARLGRVSVAQAILLLMVVMMRVRVGVRMMMVRLVVGAIEVGRLLEARGRVALVVVVLIEAARKWPATVVGVVDRELEGLVIGAAELVVGGHKGGLIVVVVDAAAAVVVLVGCLMRGKTMQLHRPGLAAIGIAWAVLINRVQ